jgi:hypothetical protein
MRAIFLEDVKPASPVGKCRSEDAKSSDFLSKMQ